MEKRGFFGGIRGQISIEFLMIMGFVMLMILPLVILFFEQSESLNRDITGSQVDKVASEIRDAADEVYYLGVPSKKTLSLYFPEGIRNILISNDFISVNVSSASGDYQVVKWPVTNITGSLANYEGIHNIVVEAHDDYVSISDS